MQDGNDLCNIYTTTPFTIIQLIVGNDLCNIYTTTPFTIIQLIVGNDLYNIYMTTPFTIITRQHHFKHNNNNKTPRGGVLLYATVEARMFGFFGANLHSLLTLLRTT
jgi:hypothetical protein